jgi:uncharacterized protein YjbJ (UPF0337 family)
MRASTRRITKGMFYEFRGTAKKIIGSLFSRRTLGAKGKLEQIAGKVHRKVGKVQGMCGF